MLWPCFNVFLFRKYNPTEHCERTKKNEADRRRSGNTLSKGGHEWTLPAQLGRLKTGQDGNGIVADSHVVPRQLSKVMG